MAEFIVYRSIFDLNFFMRLFLTITAGFVSDVTDGELLPYDTMRR